MPLLILKGSPCNCVATLTSHLAFTDTSLAGSGSRNALFLLPTWFPLSMRGKVALSLLTATVMMNILTRYSVSYATTLAGGDRNASFLLGGNGNPGSPHGPWEGRWHLLSFSRDESTGSLLGTLLQPPVGESLGFSQPLWAGVGIGPHFFSAVFDWIRAVIV